MVKVSELRGGDRLVTNLQRQIDENRNRITEVDDYSKTLPTSADVSTIVLNSGLKIVVKSSKSSTKVTSPSIARIENFYYSPITEPILCLVIGNTYGTRQDGVRCIWYDYKNSSQISTVSGGRGGECRLWPNSGYVQLSSERDTYDTLAYYDFFGALMISDDNAGHFYDQGRLWIVFGY